MVHSIENRSKKGQTVKFAINRFVRTVDFPIGRCMRTMRTKFTRAVRTEALVQQHIIVYFITNGG